VSRVRYDRSGCSCILTDGENDYYFITKDSVEQGSAVVVEGEVKENKIDASVVVSPESFNVILITPIEAAAAGKAIILSSGNFLSKIAEKEGFGLSVEFGNVKSMSTLFNKVLNGKNLANVMGNKGRDFVFKNWNWQKIIMIYNKIYNSMKGYNN